MMRRIVFICAFHLMLFSVAICQSDLFKQLEQLKGTWKMDIHGKVVYETWIIGAADQLSGLSYKLNNKDTIIFERTRIENRDNQLFYVAKVSNQNEGKEVAFKLISSSNKTFVFENPEHDFPQRVAYQFIAADSLHAWIDGKYKGEKRKEDYYYKKM